MNTSLEREVDQLHAEICAGLAEPTRILILYELADRPRNVTELANDLHLSQPLVSRHLKVLRDRGMVTATRLGATVEYQLGDRRLIEALDLLRAILRDGLTRRAGLVTVLENESPSAKETE